MLLALDLTKRENQLEQISRQLNIPILNNKINLENNLGLINISYYNFDKNIEFYLYNYKVNLPITIFSKNSLEKGKYVCTLNISNNYVNKNFSVEESKDFEFNNNILFYSPDVEMELIVEPNIEYKMLVITFDKNTFDFWENFENIKRIDNKKFFIYRNIDKDLIFRLNNIFENKIDSISKFLNINSEVLKIISFCLEEISDKNTNSNNISKEDIKSLLFIKDFIEKSYFDNITIEELSKKANMSSTKLKALFKEVFGYSIHQFQIKCKMIKAKFFLDKNDYLISEVAYKVGYNNISHFISVFKKHFNQTPKSYISKKV
jgi:AraC family transcriptional activator of pyochelin receptor